MIKIRLLSSQVKQLLQSQIKSIIRDRPSIVLPPTLNLSQIKLTDGLAQNKMSQNPNKIIINSIIPHISKRRLLRSLNNLS